MQITRRIQLVLAFTIGLLTCGCDLPVTWQERQWEEEAPPETTEPEVTARESDPEPEPKVPGLELIPLEVDDPERGVFVHVMVSFRSKAYSGKWNGWNYSHDRRKYDPDRRNREGRRDIPAVHFPVLGCYDMTDPALVEAHCQMWKMAGIDGAFFDVTFSGLAAPSWNASAVKLYAAYMAYYGLKGAVIFEDKIHWEWNPSAKTRARAVELTYEEMDAWYELIRPVQFRLRGRPVMGFFSYESTIAGKGLSRLSPSELAAWKSRWEPKDQPLLVSQWFKEPYKDVLDGQYDWIIIEGPRSKDGSISKLMPASDVPRVKKRSNEEQAQRLASGQTTVWIGAVWPGFDSRGCWGWNSEPQIIPRQNGQVYHMTWKSLEDQPIEVVQIATWNDWFEGSEIEPSVEHGYTYLEMTRDKAANFKGVAPRAGDLSIPEQIYKLRKAGVSLEVEERLREAGRLIRSGKYEEASKVVGTVRVN